MRVTLAIAWKEIVAYYTSPMAYIVALMFLALTGFFFVNSIDRPFAEATISGMLDPVVFFMMWWLPPLLTMRLLAEEQKMGTIELLLTAPVYDWEVVIGKYLASLVFFITTLSLTLYYVLLLYWFGNPDSGPIWSAYLGTILYGAAALSVGLLASSLTSNQIVAAVIGVGLLLLLTFIDLAAGQVGGGLVHLPERDWPALPLRRFLPRRGRHQQPGLLPSTHGSLPVPDDTVVGKPQVEIA